MTGVSRTILRTINPLFPATNWVSTVASSDQERILAATQRSGEVVLGQFHGYNDLTGRRVLDFGCGACGKSLFYAKNGPVGVHGVDVAIDHAGPALAAAKAAGLDLQVSRITPDNRIPLPDQSFDTVISSSVLEHLSDVDLSLSEVFRVLKPGGLFLNRWHPYKTRYGHHLNSIIGLPFAHRLFPERALMEFYYDETVAQFGKVPEAVGGIRRDGELSDIMFMNRISPAQAHSAYRRAGFESLALRYFRGMKEIGWLSRASDSLRHAFADYEVNVLRRPVQADAGVVASSPQGER